MAAFLLLFNISTKEAALSEHSYDAVARGGTACLCVVRTLAICCDVKMLISLLSANTRNLLRGYQAYAARDAAPEELCASTGPQRYPRGQKACAPYRWLRTGTGVPNLAGAKRRNEGSIAGVMHETSARACAVPRRAAPRHATWRRPSALPHVADQARQK